MKADQWTRMFDHRPNKEYRLSACCCAFILIYLACCSLLWHCNILTVDHIHAIANPSRVSCSHDQVQWESKWERECWLNPKPESTLMHLDQYERFRTTNSMPYCQRSSYRSGMPLQFAVYSMNSQQFKLSYFFCLMPFGCFCLRISLLPFSIGLECFGVLPIFDFILL